MSLVVSVCRRIDAVKVMYGHINTNISIENICLYIDTRYTHVFGGMCFCCVLPSDRACKYPILVIEVRGPGKLQLVASESMLSEVGMYGLGFHLDPPFTLY